MTTRELQDKILELKKKNDFCVLAHAYQGQEICDIADFVGDSYGLSVNATKTSAKNIVMAGVRFMAETAKLLNPDKNVYLANSMAGCPMADQIDKETVEKLKEENPGYTAVCYINTTSDTKRAVDVVVTSSSAVKIIKNIKNDKILFIPDCNLGRWVEKECPEKKFVFFKGGCPTHMRITEEEVKACKAAHPDAEFLVHPEALPPVSAMADYVGSTTGIMKYAKESPKKEFIIGTEQSIVEHLQYECPDKKFYLVSKGLVCHNMKVTTLMDVYNAISGSGELITLPPETMLEAKKPIDEMISLGG
ncbi:MAG: quinolinate synthase NadA [Catonella sp.]|nr:quinolinate synthase NadA [Catonella sp.]MDY6355915.1 quinolinate synthase NadA [Catonella sp.]